MLDAEKEVQDSVPSRTVGLFVFVKERSSKFQGGELLMTFSNFRHHSQCWELQTSYIGNITGFSIPALYQCYTVANYNAGNRSFHYCVILF